MSHSNEGGLVEGSMMGCIRIVDFPCKTSGYAVVCSSETDEIVIDSIGTI